MIIILSEKNEQTVSAIEGDPRGIGWRWGVEWEIYDEELTALQKYRGLEELE